MHLIDTSVWIQYFRGGSSKAIEYFEHLLEYNMPFGLCHIIYQEILQGALTDQEFSQLGAFLRPQHFFEPKHPLKAHEAAANLYYQCRRKGITVRSTIDCLIAQIAIEHRLILLHEDHDFSNIAKVCPELKVFSP